jgi:hypothetical protein
MLPQGNNSVSPLRILFSDMASDALFHNAEIFLCRKRGLFFLPKIPGNALKTA